MCKICPQGIESIGPPLRCFGCLFQLLKTLSCVVYQVHQTAVEGQGARVCAELRKELFILPREGLSLLPKIEGGEDVGGDGDIGRRHVLDGDWGADGGSQPAVPHTAST